MNARNKFGMTPLHWTALNGRVDVADILLAASPDVNIRDRQTGGLTPLALAILMGYDKLVQLLDSRGGSW